MVTYEGYCRPLKQKVQFIVESVNSLDTTRGIKWSIKGNYDGHKISTFTNKAQAELLLNQLNDGAEDLEVFGAEIAVQEAESFEADVIIQEVETTAPKTLSAKHYRKDGSLDMRYKICREMASEQKAAESKPEKIAKDDKKVIDEVEDVATEVAVDSVMDAESFDAETYNKVYRAEPNAIIFEENIPAEVWNTMGPDAQGHYLSTRDETVLIAPCCGVTKAELRLDEDANADCNSCCYSGDDFHPRWWANRPKPQVRIGKDSEVLPVNLTYGNTATVPVDIYYKFMLELPSTVSATVTDDGFSMILGFHNQDAALIDALIEGYSPYQDAGNPSDTLYAENTLSFVPSDIPSTHDFEAESQKLESHYSNVLNYSDAELDALGAEYMGAERGCYPCPDCGTDMFVAKHRYGNSGIGTHCSCSSCGSNYNTKILGAEEFNVEFDDWGKQEMKTHGKNISFKEWIKEEGDKHGDVPLTDWAEHEEESHDERYGAEEKTIAQEYSDVISDLGDLEKVVKKTVAPKRKPTKYIREAKGSIIDSWRQVKKDGFSKELYQPIEKGAEKGELKKDSCCCGATKKNPCECMYEGVMNCSATSPMCPCYKAINKGVTDKYWGDIANAPPWDTGFWAEEFEAEEEIYVFRDNLNTGYVGKPSQFKTKYGSSDVKELKQIIKQKDDLERVPSLIKFELKPKTIKRVISRKTPMPVDFNWTHQWNAESFDAESECIHCGASTLDDSDLTFDDVGLCEHCGECEIHGYHIEFHEGCPKCVFDAESFEANATSCFECGRFGYDDEMMRIDYGYLCARCSNPDVDFSKIMSAEDSKKINKKFIGLLGIGALGAYFAPREIKKLFDNMKKS